MPLLAIGIFSSCDDVPAPYYVLNPEDAETTITGEGTAELPYTVDDALSIINSGSYTSDKVYVKGIIVQIDEQGGSYGNATYYIADSVNADGSVSSRLEVYRGYGLGGDKVTEGYLKEGDLVIVYGQLTLYGSTPEVTQGSVLYRLNNEIRPTESNEDPSGEGTFESPYNVAKAQQLISSGEYTSSNVYVKGIVSTIQDIGTSYGNATYFISDDGTSAGQLEVYRGYGLGGEKITSEDYLSVGDTVIVLGQLTLYGSTPEITQGSRIVYLNGEEDNPDNVIGEPKGEGTQTDPYNVAKAQQLISTGANTADNVYVRGKISQIDDIGNSYGNATYYISDDGSTNGQLEVYRGYGLGGARITTSDYLKVGDEVIIYGVLTLYYSTAEITQGSQIYWLNGETGGGGSTAEPSGSGSQTDPYNVAMAQKIISNKAYTTDKVYVKGKVSQIDDIGNSYGNATYYISDDGTTAGQLEVYRGYGLGGERIMSSDYLTLGDEVIVYGVLTLYYSTPEITQGSQIYTINGEATGGGGGEVEPAEPSGDGTIDNPYNAAAANQIANALPDNGKTDNDVYIKGKIATIKEQYGTQYGNASFFISDDGSTNNTFYIFRALYLGNVRYTSGEQIKIGDDVIICGKLTKYVSSSNSGSTAETVQNEAYLYSLNGDTGSGNGGENPVGPTDGEGDGSYENPFNVAAIQSIYNAGSTGVSCYTIGYIVGYINGNNIGSGATFGVPSAPETEILIAASASETDYTQCVPVQLPKGEFRDGLDLGGNPNLLGSKILIYGSIDKYFSVCGIKNPSYAEIPGVKTIGTKVSKRRR